MTPPKHSLRLLLGYIIRLGLGLGLLGLALWTNRDQISQVIQRRPNFSLFAVGFGLYFAGVILSFVRWFFLVRASDCHSGCETQSGWASSAFCSTWSCPARWGETSSRRPS